MNRKNLNQLPRISFVFYFIAIIGLITLSKDVLFLFHYPYADPTSSSVYKLHPTFYFAFLAIVYLIITRRNVAIRELFLDKRFVSLYVIIIFFLAYVILVLHQPVAPVLITWLCPVFLLSLYFQCSYDQMNIINRSCLSIVLVNSVMGIYEYTIGARLVPGVYFFSSVGDLVSVSGWEFERAGALYGHPLIATMITALVVIALIIRSKSQPLDWLEKSCLLLTLLSLPAFGGRVSIAAMILILLIYFLRNIPIFFDKGISKHTFILISLIVYLTPVFIYVSYEIGLFDKLIVRMYNDNGSAETRLVAIKLMLDTPLLNILFGNIDKTLFYRMLQAGTPYGIEVSWIGLILSYGLVISFILLFFLYHFFSILMKYNKCELAYLVVSFLIMISSGTGLSTKSLALSQFFLVAFFFVFNIKRN